MIAVMLVAAGAAVGAPARYLTDHWMRRRYPSGFPWGTFAVNVVASFVLGVVVAGTLDGLDPDVRTAVGTGFCGALSTYSTFGWETLRLYETGRARQAVGYVVGSMACGLLAAALGWGLGRSLW